MAWEVFPLSAAIVVVAVATARLVEVQADASSPLRTDVDAYLLMQLLTPAWYDKPSTAAGMWFVTCDEP